MSSKRWVLVFLETVFVLAALLAGLNAAVDPFGAFGDRLLSWFSYDETNNPRVAKLSYLEQHHDEYDSYILGCSSTSSFPVDAFNEAFDARFYNLIMGHVYHLLFGNVFIEFVHIFLIEGKLRAFI